MVRLRAALARELFPQLLHCLSGGAAFLSCRFGRLACFLRFVARGFCLPASVLRRLARGFGHFARRFGRAAIALGGAPAPFGVLAFVLGALALALGSVALLRPQSYFSDFFSALVAGFSGLAPAPPPTAAGVFFCARRLIRPSMPSCLTTASNSER